MGKHVPHSSATSQDTLPACSVSVFSLPGEVTSEPQLLQPNYQCVLDYLSHRGREYAQCWKNRKTDHRQVY